MSGDQKKVEFDFDVIIAAGMAQLVSERMKAATAGIDPKTLDESIKAMVLAHIEKMDDFRIRNLIEGEARRLVQDSVERWGPSVIERVVERYMDTMKRWGEVSWDRYVAEAVRNLVAQMVEHEKERIVNLTRVLLDKVLKVDR